VISLLISPDFMNSDYCNAVEVARAMEKHEAGEARVISSWRAVPAYLTCEENHNVISGGNHSMSQAGRQAHIHRSASLHAIWYTIPSKTPPVQNYFSPHAGLVRIQ
jgi:hypothetical protein